MSDFVVGKLYIQNSDPTAGIPRRMVVECVENRITGFSGKVIRGNDPRIYTRGEVFNSFSKSAFEPYNS